MLLNNGKQIFMKLGDADAALDAAKDVLGEKTSEKVTEGLISLLVPRALAPVVILMIDVFQKMLEQNEEQEVTR